MAIALAQRVGIIRGFRTVRPSVETCMAVQNQELFDRLAAALEREDDEGLRAVLADAHVADIADVVEMFDDEERSRIIWSLPPPTAAEVIVEMDEAVRGEVMDDLTDEQVERIVAELPPDDAADVLGELSEEQSERVLEGIPDEQSDQIEELLTYDEESAGGLMTPDLIRVSSTDTVNEAIDAVRQAGNDEEIYYVYVTDDDKRLVGVVSLRKLVTSPGHTKLSDICEWDVGTIAADDDQEMVVNLFRKYDVAALPVVDAEGRLLGRVTHDDAMDVAEEEAAEDLYIMAGTDPAEQETTSAFRAARIRMTWLIVCLMGTALAAWVLAYSHNMGFADEQYVLLMFFVPMVMAMSGNSGVQASTILVRGLATGDFASSKFLHVYVREVRIIAIIAVSCAIMAGVVAYFGLIMLQQWGMAGMGVPLQKIALAVACGMLGGILVSGNTGIVLPFALRKVGIDPAIASGPFITTSNDVLSAIIYLFVAFVILL